MFTGPAREAAQLLARRCTHPGCTVPADLADVDHNAEWFRDRRPHRPAQRQHRVPEPTTGSSPVPAGRVARDDRGRPFHLRPDGTVVLPVGAREPSFTLDATVRANSPGTATK